MFSADRHFLFQRDYVHLQYNFVSPLRNNSSYSLSFPVWKSNESFFNANSKGPSLPSQYTGSDCLMLCILLIPKWKCADDKAISGKNTRLPEDLARYIRIYLWEVSDESLAQGHKIKNWGLQFFNSSASKIFPAKTCLLLSNSIFVPNRNNDSLLDPGIELTTTKWQ